MADSPAYQSSLISALRGGSPQASQVSVPGVTMMPNTPRGSGAPVLFGSAPMTGNLMTPPSFPREFAPQMSGNLMPVPQFAPAPDYVAPPPKPVDPNAPFINRFGYWEYPGESVDYGSSGND